MTIKLVKMAGAGLLAAGLLAAQTQTTPEQGAGTVRAHNRGRGRMAQALGLTDDQKAQAKQIFRAAAEASKPVHEQMKQARHALQAAAKNNAANTEIDRLSEQVGVLSGQMAATRARAFGKFYAILTPEQRQKLDQFGDRMQNRGFRPAAFRHRARLGGQPLDAGQR